VIDDVGAEAIVGAAGAEVVTEGVGPHVTVGVDVIADALSKGGSTESIDADVEEVETAGASDVGAADVGDAACNEGPSVIGDETDGAADTRGGGDATASGSSISSSGKSGNCSSNGETGTPAKPLGTAGVVAAPGAGFTAAGGAPTATATVAGLAGAVDAPKVAVAADLWVVETPARVGTVTPRGAPALAGAPTVAGTSALAGTPALADAPALGGAPALAGTPALVAGAIPLPGAPARAAPTGVAAALAAVETPPEATPTGLEAFFAPIAAASEDDALRGAAPAAPETLEGTALPIGTPMGLGALVGTTPDAECATPGLMIPALEVPLAAVFPTAPGGAAGIVGAGALLTPRSAALSDFVMSSDAGAEELPLPASPAAEPLADPVPRTAPAPLVPSPRAGIPGSVAPNSTSGSISSPGAMSVGTFAESGRASSAAAPEAVGFDDSAGVSGDMSSNAPWASKSSSESPSALAGEGGGDEDVDAGVAVVDVGRAPPACEPVPPDPKGSSTGRSAKGSKAGREAASIIFEPQSGDQS
jgi:hypothetical protein